ncbi:hypothetical protein BT63DRAFT_451320 [Microthyrium microscopicum]|uniref:Nuclear pore complex protein An-Nup82 n=1 Tax=Microthyrium microscopicum TaxID=703497 RepID=A0A6A6UQT2_9PEZI|nr:hypothetical protein BT63DRAFT_451320 [Microthyrium microscopicum]
MPRVLEFTPGWLARNRPGFDLFAAKPKSTPTPDVTPQTGPSRTIARRGTQLFVAVGNEVRWTDLVLLKDFEAERNSRSRKATPLSLDSVPESLFRLIKVPVSGKITQLSVSPYGDLMAIVTTHTVQVVVLHHHYELDPAAARMKTFQVGSSHHVLERAPIVSVLWHPLSPSGHCLVTLSSDAIVRMWELDPESRLSFDKSTLSIDLGKLANASSTKEDLSASEFGRGKSWMPDTVSLEPAAATFGGLGRTGEHPWSSMTLWITTQAGDLYTLCPLIPSKFHAFPGMVRTMWDSVNAKREELRSNQKSFESEAFQLSKQEEWLRNLEDDEPLIYTTPNGYTIEVLSRPISPRPEPSLQGPFDSGIDDLEVSEIIVRNVTLGEEPLEFETGDVVEDDDEESIPMGLSVICLLDRRGTLHTLLDLEEIEARWLSGPSLIDDESEERTLLLVNSINPSPNTRIPEDFFPSLTPDVMSSYAFFLTHPAGVFYFSLESWMERLRDELEEPGEAGVQFRVEMLLENAEPAFEHILKLSPDLPAASTNSGIPACCVLNHPDVGYLVMTTVNGQPFCAVLDTQHRELFASSTMSDSRAGLNSLDAEASPLLLMPPDAREPYAPDNRFYTNSPLPAHIAALPARFKIPLSENIALSGQALDLLIHAHQIVSNESQQLSEAAAKTFEACNRMLNEYHDQIAKVRDLSHRVEAITGEDEEAFESDASDAEVGTRRLQVRVDTAKARQDELIAKAQRVARKLGTLSGRQMSDRQKEFAGDTTRMAGDFGLDADGKADAHADAALLKRYKEVQLLAKSVKEQSKDLPEAKQESDSNGRSARVPSAIRKARMEQIGEMLERESYMVDATTERLKRLSVQL